MAIALMTKNKTDEFGGGMINGAIIFNGIVIGTWKRMLEKRKIRITLQLFTKFIKKEYEEITKAANKYWQFHSPSIVIDKN